jgi:hypothetical protein
MEVIYMIKLPESLRFLKDDSWLTLPIHSCRLEDAYYAKSNVFAECTFFYNGHYFNQSYQEIKFLFGLLCFYLQVILLFH